FGGSRLSIKGYVDRPSIGRGVPLSVTVVVANTGDSPATDCNIELIPGPVTCSPGSFVLDPNQENAVTCKLVLPDDGVVNLVALVSWKDAGVLKSTAEPISEINVSSPAWSRWADFLVIAGVILVFLVLIFWRFRRSIFGAYPRFAWILGALAIIA